MTVSYSALHRRVGRCFNAVVAGDRMFCRGCHRRRRPRRRLSVCEEESFQRASTSVQSSHVADYALHSAVGHRKQRRLRRQQRYSEIDLYNRADSRCLWQYVPQPTGVIQYNLIPSNAYFYSARVVTRIRSAAMTLFTNFFHDYFQGLSASSFCSLWNSVNLFLAAPYAVWCTPFAVR